MVKRRSRPAPPRRDACCSHNGGEAASHRLTAFGAADLLIIEEVLARLPISPRVCIRPLPAPPRPRPNCFCALRILPSDRHHCSQIHSHHLGARAMSSEKKSSREKKKMKKFAAEGVMGR